MKEQLPLKKERNWLKPSTAHLLKPQPRLIIMSVISSLNWFTLSTLGRITIQKETTVENLMARRKEGASSCKDYYFYILIKIIY
jgi:hypothetical protein